MAYKNVVGARRSSWRVINIEQKTMAAGNEKKLEKVKAYREKIEEGLEAVCNDVLALLDRFLIKNCNDFQCESKVLLPEDEGGLPGRGGTGERRAAWCGDGGGLQGSLEIMRAHAAHTPHPAGPGPQLLRVLLLTRSRMRPSRPASSPNKPSAAPWPRLLDTLNEDSYKDSAHHAAACETSPSGPSDQQDEEAGEGN